jgi:hypothetical protein
MLRLLKGDKEWTSVTHNLETSIADYNEELKYFSMGMLVATFNEVKCTTPPFSAHDTNSTRRQDGTD